MHTYSLKLLDAVVLLRDRLDDRYSQEQLTAETYQRRKAFRNLLRAVNKADRMISNVRKLRETVAVFLPKEVHVFPMKSHDVYAGDQIDSIAQSELSILHPAGIDVFINREPWHEIHAIVSEKLSLYDKHPTDSWTQSGSIQRVHAADFNASRDGSQKTAFYDTENRILHLSEGLSEDRFIVFEAHTIPAEIDVKEFDVGSVEDAHDTELGNMQIKTPALHEDLLIDVAFSKLLPGQAERVGPHAIVSALQGLEPSNGPTVVVPEGQHGGFRC